MVAQEKGERTTKVLLRLGLDGSKISSNAYPSFISGGRNSIGH